MSQNKDAILVVGAAGLLGKAICLDLSSNKVPFIGLVRPNSGFPDGLQFPHGEFIEVDLESSFNIRRILEERIRAVVYVAQSQGHNQFPRFAGSVATVNFSALVRLLEQSVDAGVSTFLYASSGGVYSPSEDPLDESSSIQSPSSMNMYLKTKLFAEQVVTDFSKYMNTVIARYFFIYGENQRTEMLIPRMVNFITNGQPIILPQGRGFMFNPIFNLDAARATISLINKNATGIFNIAGNEVFSLKDLCEIISDIIKITPLYEEVPQIPSDYIADITKITSNYFMPKYSITEGVRKVCDSLNI